MAAREPISILVGGAGTGKTTSLQPIHAVTDANAVPVIQAALAGRAARRMTEATDKPARTIMAWETALKGGLKAGQSLVMCLQRRARGMAGGKAALDDRTLFLLKAAHHRQPVGLWAWRLVWHPVHTIMILNRQACPLPQPPPTVDLPKPSLPITIILCVSLLPQNAKNRAFMRGSICTVDR